MKRTHIILLSVFSILLTVSLGINMWQYNQMKNIPVNAGHYNMQPGTFPWYQLDVFHDNTVILTDELNETVFEGPLRYDVQLGRYTVVSETGELHIITNKGNIYVPIERDGVTFVGVFTKGGDVPARYGKE